MATMTIHHSTMANGLCVVELDINDANWRVSKVRCVNRSNRAAAADIYQAGQLVMQVTAPDNQTTEWNINNVQLAWQPEYWNSEDQQYEPGGLDMRDYVLRTRWPA